MDAPIRNPRHAFLAALAVATSGLACSGGGGTPRAATPAEAPRTVAADPTPGVQTYVAPLTPVNEQIQGRQVTGLAAFSIDERAGTVRTLVVANNLSPDAEAAVLLQGGSEGATCPTIDADANGDDVVDAEEAIAYAGDEAIVLGPDQEGVARIEDAPFRSGVVIVYGLGAEPDDDALDGSLRAQPPGIVPVACGELTRIN